MTPSLAAENALWDRLDRDRAAATSMSATLTPALAANLSALHRTYDFLPAGTKLSLARAGVPADSPVVATVAAQAARRKTKRGFGWHSIGDVVSAGLDVVRFPLGLAAEPAGAIGDVVGGALRPATRTAFMALEALYEEPVGVLRNIATSLPGKAGEFVAGIGGGALTGAALGLTGGPLAALTVPVGAIGGGVLGGLAGLLGPDVEGTPQWAPQSKLGIAATQLATGKEVEAGSGFFVGHESGLFKAQEERAIKAASVPGAKGTRAGWTINRVLADVVSEPGTLPYNAISGLLDGITAYKTDPAALALGKAAKLNAARKAIDPTKAAEFLAGNPGRILKETLAGESNAYRISKMFNSQLDDRPEVLARLAATTDAVELDDILRPLLGADISAIPKPTVSRRLGRTRLSVDVPTGRLEWDKPAEFIAKVDAIQALGKVPTEERLANNDAIIRALAGPTPGRLGAVKAVGKSVESVIKTQLTKGGPFGRAMVEEDAATLARHMTTFFEGSVEDSRIYSAMEVGSGMHVPGVVVAGDTVGLKSPHLIGEYLHSGVPVPDMKEITRTLNFATRVYKHPLVPRSIDALNAKMGTWRALAILRPAYIPRVIGEEQARIATAGYDSLFKHPFSFIARKIADRQGAVVTDIEGGAPLQASEVIQSGLNRARGSSVLAGAPVAMKDRARLTVNDGPDLFFNGWQNHELAHLHADPLGRRIGRIFRQGVDETDTEAGRLATIDELKESFWSGNLQKSRKDLAAMADDGSYLRTRAEADTYVDSIVERVRQFTRDDADLLDHVHRGPDADVGRTRAAMARLVEEGRAPQMVVGERTLGLGAERKKILDQATDVAFDWIASKPANYFSRNPVMEQQYWNSVERMLPALSPEDKAEVFRFASDSKLSAERMKVLRKRADVAFDGPPLTRSDVHDVAAAEASNAAKKLLYDLSARKQWTQAMRLVFPFAESWLEMATTWSKLFVETRGLPARRLQQVVEGARGSGFFSTDAATGEETFTYPGSAFVSKLLVGAPIPLRGSAAGLNLFAQNPILPGFGPVVQWAANTFLPDKPEYDWIRETVAPYGAPEGLKDLAPPWMRRLFQYFDAGESDRLFNNTVGDMAAYLVSTGRYDLSTIEGQEETTAAAVSMAKRMTLLRAMASASLPTAPMPEMVAQDKDGRLVTQFALREEFRKLQDEDYDSAPQRFIELHGEDALLFMQPKSRGGSAPVEDALDWVRSNPDLVKRYKETYSYFAPHGGRFSMTAYERQFATGERKALSPEEQIKAANHRVADMKMDQAKALVGSKPTDAQRAWLNDVRDALIAEHPGYEPQRFDPARLPRQIRELEAAAGEERLRGTGTGQALTKYFDARAQAIATAREGGLQSFSRAKAMRPMREWLRRIAGALIAEHPDFGEVWEQVLSHELAADEEPTPARPAPVEEEQTLA